MLTETGAGVSLGEVAASGALVCGAAVAAGAAVESVASPSNTKTKEHCLTLSPNFTLGSFTTPACEQGISMEALSDSTVTKLCSALTTSPGFHQQLNDRHFVEVANVRNFDIYQCHSFSISWGQGNASHWFVPQVVKGVHDGSRQEFDPSTH